MDPQDSNTNLVSSNHFTSSSLSSSTTEQYFNIEIECKILYAMNGVTIEGVTDTVEGGITIVPKEDIERFIYMVFCYFDVPEDAQTSMAAKILRYAQEIVNKAPKNQPILDMYIVLAHTKELHNYDDKHNYAIDDYYGEAVEESMNENKDVRIVPASELSIKGLERVNLEEEEGNGKGIKCNCTICYEYFLVDSDEAVRMPCFHLFHKKCITIWLRNRNSFPLCRFQMLTEEDDDE